MIIIIDRARWYRGQGTEDSRLLLDNGQMCCLGFLSLAVGLSVKDILRRPSPSCAVAIDGNLVEKLPGIVQPSKRLGRSFENTPICETLMATNDSAVIKEDSREKTIHDRLEPLGYTVFFSDFPEKSANLMRQEFAYYAWENAGRPEGRDLEFWAAAEDFIKAP